MRYHPGIVKTPRPQHRRFLFALTLSALLGLGAPNPAHATDNSAQLEQLRAQIRSLRDELQSDKQRKQSLQAWLRNTEKRLGKLAALLRALERQIAANKRELANLQQQRGGLQASLQGQRVALAQQVRAAYATGRQEYLKILLNQQDPAAVARTLTYYDYYNRARLEQIRKIDANLQELATVEKKISDKTAQLEQNRLEQVEEQRQRERTRDERAEVLAKLSQDIQAKGERLAQMLEDERRLQGIIDRIADQALDAPELSSGQPFAQLRGQLIWPAQGRLSVRFGAARHIGELKWQGVLISSHEGNDVRAISHGRVAFSDWLRGFGLLTIIDHGDGYMSLYGGNQSLYKEVGDWVEAGEVIAAVGNSGGREQTGLYFEIRHNGTPTDPLKWCRGRPKKDARS